jgi:hypothetical protein
MVERDYDAMKGELGLVLGGMGDCPVGVLYQEIGRDYTGCTGRDVLHALHELGAKLHDETHAVARLDLP